MTFPSHPITSRKDNPSYNATPSKQHLLTTNTLMTSNENLSKDFSTWNVNNFLFLGVFPNPFFLVMALCSAQFLKKKRAKRIFFNSHPFLMGVWRVLAYIFGFFVFLITTRYRRNGVGKKSVSVWGRLGEFRDMTGYK